MRRVAGRALWIGNAGDLRDPKVVIDTGAEVVVELSDSEQPALLPRELVRLRFPLSDGGVNPQWLLRLAVESVSRLLREGIPLAIFCSAGMSRSVCIASAAIALAESRPLAEAVSEVAAVGPVDVSPGLLEQIRISLVGSEAPGQQTA